MSLEDYSPDIESSESWWQSAESSRESQEKFREQQKKAWAKIARTQKDEKKAKKYDFLLAGFLVKIIVDKKYDFLINSLFPCIHKWYPSNFILGILSLINIEISDKIRELSGKQKITFDYDIQKEKISFDDNNINPNIRNRINNWVEDITDSVTLEYSEIQTQKLKSLLVIEHELLLTYTSKIFIFFLNEINISITEQKAINISEFILSEVKNKIEKLEIETI